MFDLSIEILKSPLLVSGHPDVGLDSPFFDQVKLLPYHFVVLCSLEVVGPEEWQAELGQDNCLEPEHE